MTQSEELHPDRFLNKELSVLDFNARVLAMAEDGFAPVLERAKFLAIFASNIDEFYMVRVAGLKRQLAAGMVGRSPDGLTAREQLGEIAIKAEPMVRRHAELFVAEVMPGLAKEGIQILRYDELDESQCVELDDVFQQQIFPIVTPLAVDPGHPFPYISNLSLNLAVIVRDPSEDRTHFARVKVPPVLPRFITLSEEGVFVPIEDVIAAHLHHLFPGMEIVEHYTFRVTRNADIEVSEFDAEDLLRALEDELRKRRFMPAVRLEIEDGMPPHVLELLSRELDVAVQDVHPLPRPLDLSSLWELYELDRPDLKDEPFQPVTRPPLLESAETPVDIFGVLGERDILLHHPYDSFATSVQRFIEQAAQDPDVLAIKQTLYRTSGQSPIVDSLISAAEAGKQVVVLVEIKARFDEKANISWARALERAGCHVVYGVLGLKTHSKLCLVVRQEGDHLQRYAHVGTGNYNPKTARLYEDIGLLTSDQELGADVSHLFNYLTGYSRRTSYKSLIVAPHGMRERMIELIEREERAAAGGKDARIVMKLNGLADEAIVDALYKASGAGVKIDLIVRGICTLRPGVGGLSENIKVRSILGRFLEHSRVFYFRNGSEKVYIGSADMMHRNLDGRVEALVKVKSDEPRDRLLSVLDLALSDNTFAWELQSDGSWHRLSPENGGPPISHQSELMRRAVEHA